jgi:predicted transcriptional regulator
MAQLQIPITDDLMARLKALAALRRITLAELVNKALARTARRNRFNKFAASQPLGLAQAETKPQATGRVEPQTSTPRVRV